MLCKILDGTASDIIFFGKIISLGLGAAANGGLATWRRPRGGVYW